MSKRGNDGSRFDGFEIIIYNEPKLGYITNQIELYELDEEFLNDDPSIMFPLDEAVILIGEFVSDTYSSGRAYIIVNEDHDVLAVDESLIDLQANGIAAEGLSASNDEDLAREIVEKLFAGAERAKSRQEDAHMPKLSKSDVAKVIDREGVYIALMYSLRPGMIADDGLRKKVVEAKKRIDAVLSDIEDYRDDLLR